MRETAFAKARRLLVEGRVVVLHIGAGTIRAAVRGDSAELHSVAYERGRWICSCPALAHCSHAMATALVSVVPSADRWVDLAPRRQEVIG